MNPQPFSLLNHFTVPVIRSPSRSLGWFAAMSNPTPAALINIRSRHHVPSHKAPRRTKDVHMRRNIAEVRRNFSAAARYGLSLNLTVRENMEPRSPGVEAL